MCDSACSACLITANNCQTCVNSYFLSGNACVSICPPGYWGDISVNKCKSCIILDCLECSNAFLCTKCTNGKYLQNDGCVANCDQTFYSISLSFICEKCDVSCFECFGPSTFQCTTCNNRYFLLNNQCLKCGNNCFQCENKELCNVCENSYYLQENNCVDKCDIQGYYTSNLDLKCFKCNNNCLSCSGPLDSDCIDCSSNKKLINGKCEGCKVGYYLNTINQTCEGYYYKLLFKIYNYK